jgi:uroporphyrinogen-III decarboxylase
VLAAGNSETVYKETLALLGELKDTSRFILSCGGGMPPETSTANINAMIVANENAKSGMTK